MTNTTTKPDSSRSAAEMAVDLFDNWFDPIETEVRARRAPGIVTCAARLSRARGRRPLR
jgi:hypothetical protein